MAYAGSSNGSSTWGLTVPGRPPTPSEGSAQQYSRFGPREGQKLFTFSNGTCLEYGPNDPIDEFDLSTHPFGNQIALVDSAIKDIKAVRERYHKSHSGGQHSASGSGQSSDADSGISGTKGDPFHDFRDKPAEKKMIQYIRLESGIYVQVPSKYGTVTDMPSIYSHPNKSDIPGLAHPEIADTELNKTGKDESAPHHPRRTDDDMARAEGGQGQPRRGRIRKHSFPPHNDGNDSENDDGNARGTQNHTGFHAPRSGAGNSSYNSNTSSGIARPAGKPGGFRPRQPIPSSGHHHNNSSNRDSGPVNHRHTSHRMSSNHGHHHNSQIVGAGPTYQPNTPVPVNIVHYNNPHKNTGPAGQPNMLYPVPVNAGLAYPPGSYQPPPGSMLYYNSFGQLEYGNAYQPLPQHVAGAPLNGLHNGNEPRVLNPPPQKPTMGQLQMHQSQHLHPQPTGPAGPSRVSQNNIINNAMQNSVAGGNPNRTPSSPNLTTALARLDLNGNNERQECFNRVVEHYCSSNFEELNEASRNRVAFGPDGFPLEECIRMPPPAFGARPNYANPSSLRNEQDSPTGTGRLPQSYFDTVFGLVGRDSAHSTDNLTDERTPRAFRNNLTGSSGGVEMNRTPSAVAPMPRTPEHHQLPVGSISDLGGASDPGGFWIPGPGGNLIPRELEPEDFGFPRGSMDGVRNPLAEQDAEAAAAGIPRGFQPLDEDGNPGTLRVRVDCAVVGGRSVANPGLFNAENVASVNLQGPMSAETESGQPAQGNWISASRWLHPDDRGPEEEGPPIIINPPMVINRPFPFTVTYNQQQQHATQLGYTMTQPDIHPAQKVPQSRAGGRLVLCSPDRPVRRVALRSPVMFDPAGIFPNNMSVPFESLATGRPTDMGPRAAGLGPSSNNLSSWGAAAGPSANNRTMYPANTIFGEQPGMVSQQTSPTVRSTLTVRARRRRLFEQSQASSPGVGSGRTRGVTPNTEGRPAPSSNFR